MLPRVARRALPIAALLLFSLVAGADARTAYVSNSSGQSITRIDTASNTPGTPIAFPGGTNTG